MVTTEGIKAWIVATQEKFEEYGQIINTERQLSTGEYIKHFELTGTTPFEVFSFFLAIRFDADVRVLTQEQIDELLALETTEENPD